MHNKFVQLRWGAALAALMLTAPAVLVAETELSLSGVGALRYVHQMDATAPITGYAYDADTQSRFSLNQLRFTAVATSGDTSTHATLVLGEDAKVNQSFGLGLGTGGVVDLEEMYVEHKLQDNLTILVGKFATWQGWEVISPAGNTNISRGLLFTNTEAFTHTGAAVKFQLNDQVGLWGGFVNGWDVVVDNNNDKTLITRLDLLLMDERLTGGVNFYYGSETPGVSSQQLTSIDATFSYTVNDETSVAFQVIQGSIESSPTIPSAKWLGIGVWPTIKLNDNLSVGARIEWLDDKNNGIGATIPLPSTATGVTYIDIAITPTYILSDDVQARAEIRNTMADEDVFLDADGNPSGSNMTLAFELVWKF